MILSKGDSEFEISIQPSGDEWEGRIVEHNISRLTPTLHLCHSWLSLEATLAGIQRRWQRLFPGEELPDFHAAITEALSQP